MRVQRKLRNIAAYVMRDRSVCVCAAYVMRACSAGERQMGANLCHRDGSAPWSARGGSTAYHCSPASECALFTIAYMERRAPVPHTTNTMYRGGGGRLGGRLIPGGWRPVCLLLYVFDLKAEVTKEAGRLLKEPPMQHILLFLFKASRCMNPSHVTIGIIVTSRVFHSQDEIRANAADWRSLGMHGNQSGPLICEGVLTADRMIGPVGGYIVAG